MTGPVTVTDWDAMMSEVAVALLGEPNAALSSEHELRYGRRGSLAVHIAGSYAGWFRDHEAGESGGVLDLVQRACGGNRCEALTVALRTRVPVRTVCPRTTTPPGSRLDT